MSVPVIYDLKSKGTIAIPKDKLTRYSVLTSALRTHEKLSPENRHFAIRHIMGLDIDDSRFAKFVLQIYKLSNTGRFSLTFNRDLDSHIIAGKSERLSILIMTAGNKKAWPELYENSYLSKEDITIIDEMTNREYYAILNTIETAECLTTMEEILPWKETEDRKFTVSDDKIHYNSIYSKCYNNVCLSESEQKGKIISLNSEIPKVAYVADTYSDSYEKYCFPMMELIERLAAGNYINQQSGKRFSDRAISQLLEKYRKEIAMCRKYLEILNTAGI
jgi:hypothetical protein